MERAATQPGGVCDSGFLWLSRARAPSERFSPYSAVNVAVGLRCSPASALPSAGVARGVGAVAEHGGGDHQRPVRRDDSVCLGKPGAGEFPRDAGR